MPPKSRAQQKWAFAVKGEKWAKKHHMDEPVQKSKSHSKKGKKR